MRTLIVTLPSTTSDTATIYDYTLSPDGHTNEESACIPAGLLPLMAQRDGEVVAVVPAHHLSWHQVQLPQGTLGRRFYQEVNSLRLRSVLDGLLEDSLLDDTAHLHFALQPQPRVDVPVWVAVCDHTWLQAGLQALERAGRTVSRVVPEFTPDMPVDVLYVLGEPEAAQLVFSSQGRPSVWPASAQAAELLNWPEGNAVMAEPAMAALSAQWFSRNVSLLPRAQRRLQAAQSPWELAQFDLGRSSRTRAWKQWSAEITSLLHAPSWRPARWALLAMVLINLAGLNALAWKEQSAIKAQKLAVNDLLTRTFPSVRVVVDAPLQMAKEVAALQQANGVASGADMEVMLGLLGALVPSGVAAEALDFAAGELRLKGLKLPPQDFSRLRDELKSQGYGVRTEGEHLVVKQGEGS